MASLDDIHDSSRDKRGRIRDGDTVPFEDQKPEKVRQVLAAGWRQVPTDEHVGLPYGRECNG